MAASSFCGCGLGWDLYAYSEKKRREEGTGQVTDSVKVGLGKVISFSFCSFLLVRKADCRWTSRSIGTGGSVDKERHVH